MAAAEAVSETDVSISVVVGTVENPWELVSMTFVVSASSVVALKASVPVVSSAPVVAGPVVSKSVEEEIDEVVVSSADVELAIDVVEDSVTVTVESAFGDVPKGVDPVVAGSEELTRASEVLEDAEEGSLEEVEAGKSVSLPIPPTVLISPAVEDELFLGVLGGDEEDSVEEDVV